MLRFFLDFLYMTNLRARNVKSGNEFIHTFKMVMPAGGTFSACHMNAPCILLRYVVPWIFAFSLHV